MATWPYNTAAWRRLRAAKLDADPLCQYCPPGKVTPATLVDHKRAIKDGGDPFDWDNLASTCAPCHSRKTNIVDGGGGHARRGRVPVKGCDASGRPLDPEHWWSRHGQARTKTEADRAPGSRRQPERPSD